MPARHVQGQFVDRDGAVGIALADSLEPDAGATVWHRGSSRRQRLPAGQQVVVLGIRDVASRLIKHAVVQHVTLTALALALALIIAFPLALLALRSSWLRASILGVLGIIYTIPSLSLFVLLQPAFGVTHATPVVIALVAYAQLLLVRNVVVGLEEVPGEVLEAARGMGYGRTRLLFSVRLPLAMPAMMAGLRVTTVSTIALLTVGGLIQQGGLGNLLVDGFNNSFKAQIFTSIVLIVALALVADLLLLLVQRRAHPVGPQAAPGEGGRVKTFQQALDYLDDRANWRGDQRHPPPRPSCICRSPGSRCLFGLLIALPLGLWLGHRRRGGAAVTVLANVSRAMPTLGLLIVLASHLRPSGCTPRPRWSRWRCSRSRRC